MDPLMPLTAAIVTKDLEREKRLALTGAALVLNGPLALAPALVAAERARRASTKPAGGGPVKPALKRVEDVRGKSLDEARKALDGLTLDISYHVSSEAQKNLVLSQVQPPRFGDLVEEGSVVKLSVGAGPGEPDKEDERAELVRVLRDISNKLDSIDKKLDRLAQTPPPPSEPPPTGQTGSKRS